MSWIFCRSLNVKVPGSSDPACALWDEKLLKLSGSGANGWLRWETAAPKFESTYMPVGRQPAPQSEVTHGSRTIHPRAARTGCHRPTVRFSLQTHHRSPLINRSACAREGMLRLSLARLSLTRPSAQQGGPLPSTCVVEHVHHQSLGLARAPSI
jgi:hypothetical protein